MKLVIDVTRSLDRALQGRLPTGVDRVTQEYIRYLGAQAQALIRWGGRWLLLNECDSHRVFDGLLHLERLQRWSVYALVGRYYLLQWGRPEAGKLLLNTGHSGLQDATYAQRVKQWGWRGVYFLHDLIPISHPEYSRPGEKARHRQRLLSMLQPENGLLVNSRDTQQALLRYAQEQGLPVPALELAYLAPGQLPATGPAPGWDVPYFVVLGTIEPRKNHLLLLQVWRELLRHYPEPAKHAPRLVVIGQRGWECEQVLDMLERCEDLQDYVLEIPHCSDEALAGWLGHARALLFPSFAEGYGMPLVEAMRVGLPVIASDLPVFQEIAGDRVHYIHPLDGQGWMQAIMAYAQADSVLRAQYCQRLEGWPAPGWAQHFAQVDKLLQRMG